MAQMLIRNLDDATAETFKQRAREHRTSAEEEVRQALDSDARWDPERLIARAQALRDRTGPIPSPTSLELLHAGREGVDLP